jgi:hypothetical protein
MTWVRSNIRRVSHVALFALAIQLAVSFGHVHAVAAQPSPAQVARSLTTPQPASDQAPGEHPGDICAICVVMAMANAALSATPPVIPPPQAVDFSYRTAAAEFVRIASIRAGFQPRAPPIT